MNKQKKIGSETTGYQGTFVAKLPAGSAINGFQPLGALIGQKGLNRMDFCKSFIAMTSSFKDGDFISVKINVKNKKFTIKLLGPCIPDLIKKILGISKGSDCGLKKPVATITKSQILDIAKAKLEFVDNIHNIENMCKCIESTAKSMGIIVQ